MLRESRLKVSVWIAEEISESAFRNYLDEDLSIDDAPANQFAADLSTQSIDPDCLDGRISKISLSLPKLLKRLAYASTFMEEVVTVARSKGIDVGTAVIALYGFEYCGRWPRQSPFRFLGAFDYFPAPKGTRTKSVTSKDYYYLEHDTLRKFWAIELRRAKHIIRTGLIGLSGKEHIRELADVKVARRELDRAIKAKQKAGYVLRPKGTAPKPRGKRK